MLRITLKPFKTFAISNRQAWLTQKRQWDSSAEVTSLVGGNIDPIVLQFAVFRLAVDYVLRQGGGWG